MAELRPATELLLLSFNHRDALATELTKLGWRAEAARRSAGIEQRFLRSAASIILVDARDALPQALGALKLLATAAARRGAALAVILDWADAAHVGALVDAGATQIVEAPLTPDRLDAALRLARRFVARASGMDEPPLGPEAAPRDALTGLALVAEAREWINARLNEGQVSLAAISISRFDMINAAFGPEAGDAVLRSLAHRVEALVAEVGSGTALLARLSGAELSLSIAGDMSAERLLILYQAIADAIERPFSAGNDIVRLGCRIGAVQSTPRDRSAAALMKRAAVALAEAKESEAEPVRLVTHDIAELQDFSASLHADLRSALDRGEVEILFQPQVALASGRIDGVEALARWQHPRHGELGAVTLFSAAEQSGYLAELSAHVQRRALEAAAHWPKWLRNLRLSINVTAQDMARRGFASKLLAAISASGIDPSRVTIEITETGIMADLKASARVISALRDGGCRVAIDDFGTGHSSLAYLKNLPVDYLKIDSRLAGDIVGSPRDRVIVRGVLQMARALGLAVIAEGVETSAQRDLLAEEGCTLYQGFLCAPPLSADELSRLISLQAVQ